MKKNEKIFFRHILEAIERIEEFTKDFSKEEFMKSVKTQDAVIRRLEIIGEAAGNISNKIKNKYEEIPWKKIIGMRNILIHHYFGVDLDTVWVVIKKDLPKLKQKIKKILKEVEKE